MKNIRNRALATTALTAVAVGVPIGDADAVPSDVLFVDQFDEEFPDEGYAEFLESACGVDEVVVDVHAAGRVLVYAWGAEGSERVTARATNTQTGDYFVQSFRNHFRAEATETVGDDGLVRVAIEEDYSGLAQQFRAPGTGVIVRDAGTIGFRVDLVIDPTLPPEEQVIEVVETFDARGPHPWVEQGFEPTAEQGAEICGALGGVPALP